jgi:hypothetical protein
MSWHNNPMCLPAHVTTILCACQLMSQQSYVLATSCHNNPMSLPPHVTTILCACHLMPQQSYVLASSCHNNPMCLQRQNELFLLLSYPLLFTFHILTFPSAKWNKTWQGWPLGGSLSKLCPTAPPSIQDGCCY